MRTISRPPYTYAELSALTGWPQGTLRQWQARGKLPAPDGHVGQTPVWDRLRMEDWVHSHQREQVS